MNSTWEYRQVPIKFQLSDKTLFAPKIWVQARQVELSEAMVPVGELAPPAESLQHRSEGFLIRSLPVSASQPVLGRNDDYLCYVPSQYQRYYIDLRQSFSDYKQRFSSKTRATISRKVRKYASHCGGEIRWRVYKSVEQMQEFFLFARSVSAKSYQERLLDAGLPASDEFYRAAEALALEGRIRAFILFDGAQPVSYLYCPVSDGVLTYQYLGYDPQYTKWSVGTVLQWLALEHLFEEGCFRLFDFTEGESEHKRLFATHSVRCANVFFLRATPRNRLLVESHRALDAFSKGVGDALERLSLKAKVKKLIRVAG